MQTLRTTVPRIATTATVLVGLVLALPGGRAQADPEPPGPGFNGGCVAKNVTGKYTQTASFPGIGRLRALPRARRAAPTCAFDPHSEDVHLTHRRGRIVLL
jgi:hypothetical protein